MQRRDLLEQCQLRSPEIVSIPELEYRPVKALLSNFLGKILVVLNNCTGVCACRTQVGHVQNYMLKLAGDLCWESARHLIHIASIDVPVKSVGISGVTSLIDRFVSLAITTLLAKI